MSDQRENISVRVCRVSFLCKICRVVFNSISIYCTHKVENHHSLEFLHNKSLVFEESESTLEHNDNEPVSGFDTAAVNELQTVQLNNLVTAEVKQEPPAPSAAIFNSDNDTVKSSADSSNTNHVNLSPLQNDDSKPGPDEPTHISTFKTEWVENTLVIYETPSLNKDPLRYPNPANNLDENKEYENTNYSNVTETQSSIIWSDADAELNLNHGQVDEGDECLDPLEDFDMTQSSQAMSTLTTTEMEHEYFNESRSDSDDDIICLDQPVPSAPNKIASSTGPTAKATVTTTSNSLILSQLKLQCQICSKPFTSSAQLGIHVSICKLYNRKIQESAAELTISQSPAAVITQICSRSRSRSKVKQKSAYSKSNNFVNCKECSTKVRRCSLIAHLRTDHKIFVEDLDRKYVCDSCGSAFPTRKQLTRHARVHSDERPFVCSFPGCYDSFKAGETLKHHQKTNHPQLFEMLY